MMLRIEKKMHAYDILDSLETFTTVWIKVGCLAVEPKKASFKTMLKEYGDQQLNVETIETDSSKTITIG